MVKGTQPWEGGGGGRVISGRSCPWQQGGDRVTATYSSEGVLMGLHRYPQGQPEEKLAILRFGDRPVAIWKKVGSNPATLTYLTTDHLGTPILAMNSTGTAIWSGGFEPFGRDFRVPSAESSGVFLRLPGQWEDPFFDPSTLGANLHYNLHRWYEPGTGRYISPDPLGQEGDPHPFSYAGSIPTRLIDTNGLKVTNNANCIAFVKDEGSGISKPLLPGQTWDGPQDGFALPCCRPCEVFKTTNGVDAVLGSDCTVTLSGGLPPYQWLIGGWKNRDWQQKRQSKKDFRWDNIFDDACSPPRPCFPETREDS